MEGEGFTAEDECWTFMSLLLLTKQETARVEHRPGVCHSKVFFAYLNSSASKQLRSTAVACDAVARAAEVITKSESVKLCLTENA